MLRFAFVALPRAILGALMLAGIAINFANVIGRYLFGQALFWAEETMVFITIWACSWAWRRSPTTATT